MTNHPPPPPAPPSGHPIPVICDLCRAHGLSGEDPFEQFGALLDFDPVPRLKTRADGWGAETQRAFIAALSLTGTRRSACRAVGKSAFGVDQLLSSPGGEGFRAAHEEALAIASDERSRRLAEGLRTVAAEQSGWRPPDPPWAGAAARRGRPPGHVQAAAHPERVEGPADADPSPATEKALHDIMTRYLLKVESERKARIEGRIIEADFYLRQLTFIEVSFDLLSGDGFKLLNDFRIHRQPLVQIAETPFSKIMGEMRRKVWAEMGDPSRPEHPPARYLADHGSYSSEPQEHMMGGTPESIEQQQQELDRRHKEDAEAQIAWEAEARREFEERRDASSSPGSPAGSGQSEGEGPG